MIVAAVPDLMDRSKFADAEVTFIRRPADAERADLVLVDLDRCGDIEGFGALPIRTVGFGAHLDAARLREARAAGFDEVMARSVFFRRLPEFLRPPASGRIDPDVG